MTLGDPSILVVVVTILLYVAAQYGLRDHLPTRPARLACYPVLVHRLVLLLHASFRPRLTATPLHFANPSPPSGWAGDLHPQAVKHARHTKASRIDRPATWAKTEVRRALFFWYQAFPDVIGLGI